MTSNFRNTLQSFTAHWESQSCAAKARLSPKPTHLSVAFSELPDEDAADYFGCTCGSSHDEGRLVCPPCPSLRLPALQWTD